MLILISAVEHCDYGLPPFSRFKNFRREVDRFLTPLKRQKAIFKTECLHLLTDLIERDVVAAKLTNSDHQSWSNRKLKGQFAQLLGDSRQACVEIVELIDGLERIVQDNLAKKPGNDALPPNYDSASHTHV